MVASFEASRSSSPLLGVIREPIDRPTRELSEETGEMVRKQREPRNLRRMIGGRRGGHTIASASPSRSVIPPEDAQPSKRTRTDIPECRCRDSQIYC